MGESSHETQTRELLAEHGKYIRNTKHGELWEIPVGTSGRVMTPDSNGHGGGGGAEHRAWKNALADVRRVLREHQRPEADEEDDVATTRTEMIQAAGVHLETTTKKIVERTTRAVLDKAALLQIVLGIDGIDDGDTVKLDIEDLGIEAVLGANFHCTVTHISVREE